MDEPRLFETHGVVDRMAVTFNRRPDGWHVLVQSRREGDAMAWDRELYDGLSWGEVIDVLTATSLS